ncbi:aminotransferase class-V [Pseudomassariella vexata]|uniref:Aminotransferase class-V n=1 Tax=Pseudomassariella vexata TaxID=1141098 RepID=A0A1Y2E3A3_9PEZI|nr:aminotransferase class-V [Pseudomassariella vexata]ORY65844.1 aminotransferase class-V [Pseudomassariella vexata]
MTSSPMDISNTRSKFPALQQDQVFFDNAGGSQILGTVIESIANYLSSTNVQLGASYKVGKASTARYAAGVVAGAKYINAQESEIVYGSSTTQLFRNLAHSLQFNQGDEIIVSLVDHEANIAPWVDLAERQKLVLKWWAPSKTSTNPKLEPADLEALMTPQTRLVTCTHCSNILGSITNVKAIATSVHKIPGALLCVDAVAYAPHRRIDVKDLGVDFYAFSWYKVYGPHISMLYASRAAQRHMRSLNHFFKSGDSLEDKIGLAGASYELMQAITAVVDYLSPVDEGVWDAVKVQERSLQETLLQYLNSRPDITVYGETSADGVVRVPTVAFRVKGWNSKELVEMVEKDTNFGFRWGAFYSNRLVHELLGLDEDGVVRISMVHYNTVDEVKGIIAAIDKVLSQKSST